MTGVRLLIITLFIVPVLVLQSGDDPAPDQIDEQVAEILEDMTVEEKIGQLFMVSWSGLEPGYSLKTLLTEYHVGSVYISGANFKNTAAPTAAEQVAELTNELQTIAWEGNKKTDLQGNGYFLPLFLAVDHEGDGARYTRIRSGMTTIPSPLAIGATWSPENAEKIGRIVGSELSSIGINMLLGPVLDVVDDPETSSLGNLDTRVFGGDPHWVGELSRAYIRGVHDGSDNNMVTVAKHFPGHGDSDRATDRAIAETDKDRDELLDVDLVPFVRVAEQVDDDALGRTDAMMSSHIGIRETNDYPISLYYDHDQQMGGITRLMNDIGTLNAWHENGFIVADSLGVGALKPIFKDKDEVQIAKEALLAGNDLLIAHGFIKNPTGKLDKDIHEKLMEVMDHFQILYETDGRVQHRIDAAVSKIVRAKLLMSEELMLESTLVKDTSIVPADEDVEFKKNAILTTATESIALISPDKLPDDLSLEQDDKIVFFVHNVGYLECEECLDDWRLLRVDNFENFLAGMRNFDRAKISSHDYYQEIYQLPLGDPGISQFLYWHYSDLPKEDRDEISEEEALFLDIEIRHADWIIFAFLTGDCGPDAYRIEYPFDNFAARCLRGEPEADTLIKFLDYFDTDTELDAKIGAISFGAPPWKLGKTDVSHLDVYFGAFNQLVPFQEQALRALLKEFKPTGASPIDVKGANYRLEERLQPDGAKKASLSILNSPTDGWIVGDTIELETSEVVDNNGNPIVSDIPAIWRRGKEIESEMVLEPSSVSSDFTFGKTKAEFTLLEPGEIVFFAQIGDHTSEELKIEVMPKPGVAPPEVIEETSTLAPTEQKIVEQATPVPPTATNTLIPTAIPKPSSTPIGINDNSTDDSGLTVDRRIAVAAIAIPALIAIVTIFLTPIFGNWWENRGEETKPKINICDMHVDAAMDKIARTDDIVILKACLLDEQNGQNRVTVINALEKRLRELDEELDA